MVPTRCAGNLLFCFIARVAVFVGAVACGATSFVDSWPTVDEVGWAILWTASLGVSNIAARSDFSATQLDSVEFKAGAEQLGLGRARTMRAGAKASRWE